MSRPKKGEPGYEEANAKHRQTMIKKYGVDGYHRRMQELGRKGGKACVMKSFALDLDRARKAGAIGGAKSIKGYKLIKEDEYTRLYKNRETGAIVKYIYDAEVGKFVKDDHRAIVEEIKNENWFRRKQEIDPVEARRATAIDLVHDLSKADKDRLIAGMELAWQADEKFRKVQTREEKDPINKAERELAKEEK